MCVPVSIGFGKTALVLARIENSVWQLGVRSRKHATTTCGISEPGFLAKNQLPTQAPEWITPPGIASWIRRNRRDCFVPLDNWSSTYGTLKESGGGGGGGGVQSAHVHTLELQLQRYHEEPRKPMDRGDCQGSLHSSWSLVRPCDSAWGPSAFIYGRTTVRWLYLTSCQRHFGGLPGCSRIRFCVTWLVLLRACRHWVQWWLYNM